MADQGASSSSSSFMYDVFISFRGDTRFGFTDHLYQALTNKGVNTFRHDRNLKLGDEIGPALVDAIEKSRMSIVVLSQEYASSSWCLDELVKIMECSDNGKKRPVVPIFYQVEPSDVRHQNNQYETAMIHHQNGRNAHKVHSWKSALSLVANLNGKHCKDSYESDIINMIAGEVLEKLPCEPLHIKHPVEPDSLEDGVEIKKYCVNGECDFEGTKAAKSSNKQKRDVEEGDIVGFDDSLGIVINQLKKEDSFRNVVSITGMGGLGKTTLAEKVYNNNEVKRLFPCRAWSCVSKDFKERKVFLDILDCLKPSTSKYENLSEQELKKEVRECLNRNKCLIVLDDIWEPEVWDKVEDVFPNNNNGSMILITSRNDQVAHCARSRSPHLQLRQLELEKSWELFCRKVFGKEKCPLGLEPIGRSIVERCGGLPLAIITIAGLAAKKRSYKEWSQIKDFVPWYLAKDSSKLMDVLKVSYDNLPEYLKPCFLYFGIFPEDYKILARELIQLWMVEGFIQPEKIATSEVPKHEDVGDDYLKELVDRHLVQVVNWRSDGGVKTCRVHDLLHELCILESKADKFLEVCTESTMNSLSNSCRLSLLCNEQHYMSLIKCSQSSTRSLFFFAGKRYPDYIMKNFPVVHVLHVARQVTFIDKPRDLTMMIHLKYLRLEPINVARDIPDWIWSLNNLEMLDLRGWFAAQSTISIWKLERLKHLYIQFYVKLGVDKEGANNKRMWNLQTLTTVVAEPLTMMLINNGSFPKLTKLGLLRDFRSDHLLHELLGSLHHLCKLRTLKINWCSARISLDGVVFPSNISKITLKDFAELDSGCMSALGRITSLRILKLVDGRRTADTLDVGSATGDFPQLLVFYIDRLSNVKRLTLENGAMALFQRVVIRRCGHLKEVPDRLLSLCDKAASNL